MLYEVITESLPPSGSGYQLLRPAQRRFYGHPELIDYLQDLARQTHSAGLPRITSYNVCYTKLLRPLLSGRTLPSDGQAKLSPPALSTMVNNGHVRLEKFMYLIRHSFSIFGPYKHGRITSYNVCYTKLLRRHVDEVHAVAGPHQ